jgi:hypothetical protein
MAAVVGQEVQGTAMAGGAELEESRPVRSGGGEAEEEMEGAREAVGATEWGV